MAPHVRSKVHRPRRWLETRLCRKSHPPVSKLECRTQTRRKAGVTVDICTRTVRCPRPHTISGNWGREVLGRRERLPQRPSLRPISRPALYRLTLPLNPMPTPSPSAGCNVASSARDLWMIGLLTGMIWFGVRERGATRICRLAPITVHRIGLRKGRKQR